MAPNRTIPPNRSLLLARSLGLLLAVAAVASLAACGGDDQPAARNSGPVAPAPVGDIPGVVLERTSRAAQHVSGSVNYPKRPPSGGDHDPVWQNCGIYTKPVRDENAVHDLEHGAVWIAYRPDLAAADVATLASQAKGHAKVLMSPYPSLTKPVVLVAWEHRLELDSVSDPRLAQFVQKFEGASSAPEPGAPCSGGTSATAG